MTHSRDTEIGLLAAGLLLWFVAFMAWGVWHWGATFIFGFMMAMMAGTALTVAWLMIYHALGGFDDD